MRIVIVALASACLGGCAVVGDECSCAGQALDETPPSSGWVVRGTAVPSSFLAEVSAAAAIIRARRGWLPEAGVVIVCPSHESLGGYDGRACGSQLVAVVYDPPRLGVGACSTALEHEFCHAAGANTEAAANACDLDACPLVRSALSESE